MDIARIDEEIGTSIRLVRLDREMSQEELSAAVTRLGYPLSQATVGKIERGDRKVTLGEAEAIAQALGTNAAAFVRGPADLSTELFVARLRGLRTELMETMHAFEIAQQVLAMVSDGLSESQLEDIRELVLEPLEDIVTEYRRDREAETIADRIRDEMDGPVNDRPIGGLLGEHVAKFGPRKADPRLPGDRAPRDSDDR